MVKTPKKSEKIRRESFFPRGRLSITFFLREIVFLWIRENTTNGWIPTHYPIESNGKFILGIFFLLRPRSYAGFELRTPTHKSADFFWREFSLCVCFSNDCFKELLNKISWNSRKLKMISYDPRLSGWFHETEIRWGPLSRFLCLFLRIWLWRRQT